MSTVIRWARAARTACLAVAVALSLSVSLSACHDFGPNTGPGQPPAAAILTVGASNTPLAANASIPGATRVSVNNGGAADALSFFPQTGAPLPLAADPKRPGSFWLPLVTQPTRGELVHTRGTVLVGSIPVTLTAYATSGIAGEAVLNFLGASEAITLDAIARLKRLGGQPELLALFETALAVTGQQIEWVNAAIKNGSATMEDARTGQPAILDRHQLRVMDQVVMYYLSLTGSGGNAAPVAAVARRSRIDSFASLFMASAHAQTGGCPYFRPTKIVTSPSVLNDIAWCQRQNQINQVDSYVNIGKAVLEGLGPVITAASVLSPPAAQGGGLGLALVSTIVGAHLDLASVLVRISEQEWSAAGEQTLIVVADQLLKQTVEAGVQNALGLPAGTRYTKLLEDLAIALTTAGVDAIKDKLVNAFKPPATQPPAPPPPSPGGFGVANGFVCRSDPNPGGGAIVTGRRTAELAPAEQITVLNGTTAYYIPEGKCGGRYNLPEGTVNFPEFAYARSNCTPATGLDLHPDYYATCVNPHQSGHARNIFVDINQPISPKVLALSPGIIFIACRATELNFNPLEVVARARPAVSLQIPLTCPVPGGTLP